MEEATHRSLAHLPILRDQGTAYLEQLLGVEQGVETMKIEVGERKHNRIAIIEESFDELINFLVSRKKTLREEVEQLSKRRVFELTDLQDRLRFQRESPYSSSPHNTKP